MAVTPRKERRVPRTEGLRAGFELGVVDTTAQKKQHLLCDRRGRIAFLFEPEEGPRKGANQGEPKIAAVDSLSQREIVDQAYEDLLVFVA